MLKRYEPFIYDENDPAEVADRPPAFDLADPLLPERLALENTLAGEAATLRGKRYAEQAGLAEGIFAVLEEIEPLPGATLCMGSGALFFDQTVSEDASGHQQGVRSPKLSRLKLVQAAQQEPRVLRWALIDLWRDRQAWTMPTYGQRLTW